MEEIIQFESPKQLYALGLIDQHNRIAACFVNPDETHPEPEIVAVPLTQLGLLHIGNCYHTIRDGLVIGSQCLAGKRIQNARVDCRQICMDSETAKCPAPYELDLFRRPELFLQKCHTFRVGRTVYKISDTVAFAALTACCNSAIIRLILVGENIENYMNSGPILCSDKYQIELRDDRPSCLAAEQNGAWLYCAAKYQFAAQTNAVLQPDESITHTPFAWKLSCCLPNLPYGYLDIEYIQFRMYRFVVHLRIRNLPVPHKIVIVDHHPTPSNAHGVPKNNLSESSVTSDVLPLASSTSAPHSGPVSRLYTMCAASPLNSTPKYEYIRSSSRQLQSQITGGRLSKTDATHEIAYSTNQPSPNGNAELLPADVLGCGKLDFSILPIRFALFCDALQTAHARKMISAPHCSVWHSRCYNSFIGLAEIQQTNRTSYAALLAIAICHGNHIGILEIYPDDGSSISCAATLIICGSDDESIYRRALRLVQCYKDTAGHWIKHSADDTSQQAAQRNLAFAGCISVRHTSNYVNLLCSKLCALKS